MSKGQDKLEELIKDLFPGEHIEHEHHVGERLRLDIYLSSSKLAAEYHGIQHFKFSSLFHKSKEAFEDGVKRDERKAELCREQGIALAVFRYDEKLDSDLVFDRMLHALNNTPYKTEEKPSRYKGYMFYERSKERAKEYRKRSYRELKERFRTHN